MAKIGEPAQRGGARHRRGVGPQMSLPGWRTWRAEDVSQFSKSAAARRRTCLAMGVHRRFQAMTLAEIIVALMLLSLLIVSVLAVFTGFLSSSAKSNDQTVGVFFAEEVLDQYSAGAKKTYPAFALSANASDGFYTQDAATQTRFFYTVTATDLDPVSNANATSAGEKWLLEVDVRWWSTAPGASRAGYGDLHVHHGRMVYVSR